MWHFVSLPLLLRSLSALALLTAVGLLPAAAQSKRKSSSDQKEGITMEAAKWWFGIRGGVNFLRPDITARYPVISPTTGQAPTEKQYDNALKHPGLQAGVQFGYAPLRYLSVQTQPVFMTVRYGYQTNFSWNDDGTGRTTTINQTHRQTLDYITVPLVLRWNVLNGKIQPFLQAGAYCNWLMGASKNTETITTDTYTDGGSERLEDSPQLVTNRKNMASTGWGWTGGAGLSCDLDFFRVALEGNILYGMKNAVNPGRRFSDDRLVSGAYETPDDLKLRHLTINLTVSTPFDKLIHLKAATSGHRSGPGRQRRR